LLGSCKLSNSSGVCATLTNAFVLRHGQKEVTISTIIEAGVPKMKRVLLTAHKFFPEHRAGTEVLTLRIAKELTKRGYEVLVVAANPPDVDARRRPGRETSDYEYEGIRVHIVEEPLRLKNYKFSYEYFHPEVSRHFAEIVKAFSPDLIQIVHAQNLSAGIIEEARKLGLPVVFYATDFWFVCPIVQLKRPDGAVCRGPGPMALKCLDCYTPKLFPPASEFEEAIASRHGAQIKLLSAFPKPLSSALTRILYGAYCSLKAKAAVEATLKRPKALRDYANQMQAILVPTKLLRDVFIENGIAANLVHHVPFGIDTASLNPYQQKTPSDKLRIGFIGTLFEHKGPDLLVKAFLALPPDAEAELKIYGDPKQFPEYGEKLMAMAHDGSANASKIHFAGTFPQAKFGEVMANLDLLVVPSRWYENTPLVIQSALATKTPLIATDLGGMAEIIHHEVNGLLFALNDSRSLKDQLLKVLNDRSLIERFRANIQAERSVEQMVDDIEAVYNKLWNAPAKTPAGTGANY
ncbi:MAG TPA: glycosyltransferase family 4 protein, partial [Candidatus Obscuribacterales bacterium]